MKERNESNLKERKKGKKTDGVVVVKERNEREE